MRWRYTPYVLPLVLTCAVAVAIAAFTWRRRREPGAIALFLMALAILEWSAGNVMELGSLELDTKLFWANLEYAGMVVIPVLWLVLALQYAGRGAWLTARRVAALLAIPAATVVLVWTNGLHGLMRHGVSLDTSGPFSVVSKEYGPWFWVAAAYSHLLLVVGTGVAVVATLGSARFYRGQAVVLALFVAIPYAANVLYIFGASPIARLDITPISAALSGAVMAWGLFRRRLLNVMPVARAAVVESMGTGVVVVDALERVVDLNPAASRMVGWQQARAIGRPVAEVLGALRSGGQAGCGDDGQRQYEVVSAPLTNARGRAIGRLVLIRDITERRAVQARMVQRQRALAAVGERERLARSLHDDLGQVLGYLNVQSQAIREAILRGRTGAARSQLERLMAVTQDAHAELRRFIGRRGAGADESGSESEWRFVGALGQVIRRFEQGSGIGVECEIPDEVRGGIIDPAVEVQLLGIIQEALANVAKHSRAKSARVAFTVRPGEVLAVVEDDGVGFDPAAPVRGHEEGFGLAIMRERAGEVGCGLVVDSAPGRGTRVSVRVPAPGSEAT